MVFRGAEISATIDEKFRLIIPWEIIKARGIGDFVEIVNGEAEGHLITRIYYQTSGIKNSLRVRIKKNKKQSPRITLSRVIREKSFSFYYGRSVMLVDRGKYLEILPWPNC